MSQVYAYTLSIWPPFLTVLLLVGLSLYGMRQRSVPGALPFAVGCLFGALWAAGSVMEAFAVALETKIFWFKFQGLWQLPTATAFTCFVLEYAWPGRWLNRRNLILLSLPCLLAFGLVLTNDLHQLIWRGFDYEGGIIPLRAAGNWLLFAYGYGLGVLNLATFIWLFVRSPQHRWPVAIMLTGLLLGRLLYLMEAARLQLNLAFSVLPIAFEYLMYAVALFGFRIFDPIALARQSVPAQMREGMLVLDPQGRVVGSNLAAERILRLPAKHVMGQPVGDLIPTYVNGHLARAEEAEIEISLGIQPEVHYYLVEASSLKDWRGLEVGRLLLLHDVTGQKQAQTQLLEQQRALAMLQEREQLGRELHDGIGQVLGYAGFQLEAVQDRIIGGQAALSTGQVSAANNNLGEAGNLLARLRSIVEEAHADVREHILNLRLAPSEQRPFFAAIQHYMDGFCQNYGIQTSLSVGEGVNEDMFDPGAQMQLFRIIQEALSNARKHGQSSCVQVSFESQDHHVRIHIQDNGRGFDSAQAKLDGERHFGLRFMHERAEQIGGNLHVDSVPGKGTCVHIEVPVEGKDLTTKVTWDMKDKNKS